MGEQVARALFGPDPVPLDGGIEVLHAVPGQPVFVADFPGLFDAEFSRQSADLLIEGGDGAQVLIRGYFAFGAPPDLMTDTGAVMAGRVAAHLAGSPTPGQYATAELAQASEPIGEVESVEGTVEAVRADGTRVTLAEGDSIFQGDVIESQAGGNLGVIFVDDSTMTMGENGRMVMDEFVYDAESEDGTSNFDLVQGSFAFLSGQIAGAAPDAMTLKTPVGKIGIRGSLPLVDIADNGETQVISGQDPRPGAPSLITFTNQGGTSALPPGGTLNVTSLFELPAVTQTPLDQLPTKFTTLVTRMTQLIQARETEEEAAAEGENEAASEAAEDEAEAEGDEEGDEGGEEGGEEVAEEGPVEEVIEEETVGEEDELLGEEGDDPFEEGEEGETGEDLTQDPEFQGGGPIGPEGVPGDPVGPGPFGPDPLGGGENIFGDPGGELDTLFTEFVDTFGEESLEGLVVEIFGPPPEEEGPEDGTIDDPPTNTEAPTGGGLGTGIVTGFVNNQTSNFSEWTNAVNQLGATINSNVNFESHPTGALQSNFYATSDGVTLTASGDVNSVQFGAGPADGNTSTTPKSSGEGAHPASNFLFDDDNPSALTISFNTPKFGVGLSVIDYFNPTDTNPLTIEAFTGPNGTGTSLGSFSSVAFNFQNNNTYFMGVVSEDMNIESLVFTDVNTATNDTTGIDDIVFA